MAEYVYTKVPGKIRSLLDKVRSTGVPPKASVQWLKTLGFRSSNDVSLLSILRFIGFTDLSGVPSTIWSQYRGAHHKAVLGSAIRQGYADLFAVYPDAHLRNQTELDHVFSTSSTAGRQVIAATIGTFKSLVAEAEFSSEQQAEFSSHSPSPIHTPAAAGTAKSHATSGPTVHIDIQVHISPEASMEQIDKIFESMAKHLYGRKADE